MNKGGRPTKEFPNDKATNEWLDAQANPKTKKNYRHHWARFLEYAGMTGDQILDSRKADKETIWEKKTIAFKTWRSAQGVSDLEARAGTTAVRSFFAYHRVPLQFRRQESATLRQAKRKTEDYRFSVEDLKKMSDVGDLNEKYVVVVGKSFGLRAGDFLRLTRSDLETYIDRDPPISIGEYSTQKESAAAYPFVDSDAKPIIKLVLEQMTRERRTSPKEPILTYTDNIQLSRVLQRVADKAGINYRTVTDCRLAGSVHRKVSARFIVTLRTIGLDYPRFQGGLNHDIRKRSSEPESVVISLRISSC